MYEHNKDPLVIAGKTFASRLIMGITGFAPSIIKPVVASCGCNIVTHTINSLNVDNIHDGSVTLKDFIPENIQYIPNTHGCKTADEAIQVARKIKQSGLTDWIKLEVSPNQTHYMSDGVETLKAAEVLVKEGFTVLPYIHADPVLAKRMEEVGCATVMPLGAPIGTGRGLKAREFIEMIVAEASVPVIVDAGIGLPSHATQCLEMGVAAVIVHTAVLYAEEQLYHAEAFKLAVKAGRLSYLAKPGARRT